MIWSMTCLHRGRCRGTRSSRRPDWPRGADRISAPCVPTLLEASRVESVVSRGEPSEYRQYPSNDTKDSYEIMTSGETIDRILINRTKGSETYTRKCSMRSVIVWNSYLSVYPKLNAFIFNQVYGQNVIKYAYSRNVSLASKSAFLRGMLWVRNSTIHQSNSAPLKMSWVFEPVNKINVSTLFFTYSQWRMKANMN